MTQQMGIGPLGNPEIIFVRKFRFILEGKYLQGQWNKAVDVQWTNHTIIIRAYEVIVDGIVPIHEWADAMEKGKYLDEELTLTTYSGVGEPLYCYKFTNPHIFNRENNYDYSVSDECNHEVHLSYETCEKIPVKNDSKWVEPKNVEELEVNHLNAKIWVK